MPVNTLYKPTYCITVLYSVQKPTCEKCQLIFNLRKQNAFKFVILK